METEKAIEVSIHPFLSFLSTLSISDVSFRLVAEREDLLQKISANFPDTKLKKVTKLLSSEMPEIEDRLRVAKKYNEAGYAVYWVPQEYRDGYNEGYSDIKTLRCVVVDLDGVGFGEALDWAILPYVIVETSPGHYHLVYRVNFPSVDVDRFNELAFNLTALFDGDLNAAKATQVFRAPGFFHAKVKEKSFLSRVIWTNPNPKIPDVDELEHSLALKQRTIKQHTINRRGERSGEYKRSSSAWWNQKLDLDALLQGEVEVGEGERHDTILRLQVKLLSEGLKEEEVEERVRSIVEKSFVKGVDFLNGGVRGADLRTCMTSALSYVKANREREKERKAKEPKREIEKERKASFETKTDLPDSLIKAEEEGENETERFVYDFSKGSLAQNKYSETALVARILQKWGKSLVKTESQDFAFNRLLNVWKVQEGNNYAETKTFCLDALREMLEEEDYVSQFETKKRGLNEEALKRAQSQYYKCNVINGVCKSVLNNVGVKRLKGSDFDADENLFFCANGVLNLETREIREPRQEDYLLKRSSIFYDESATCEGFEEFLDEIFVDNEDSDAMKAFIGELFGYTLSGYINAEKIFCHLGDGRNGKSKLLSALRLLMGDYSTGLEPSELVSRKGSLIEKSFERIGAKVEGSRCVIIDDFEMESQWNEAFVKLLTGKEFRARAEYQRSRFIKNRAKFHIGLNQAPTPQAENAGILARLCILPYEKTFLSDGGKSIEIDRMIEREASGILNFAISGFERFLSQGKRLKYPRETDLAMKTYREEHFKVEAIVFKVVRVPKTNQAGKWLSLSEISDLVTVYLNAEHALENIKVSNDALGALLKRNGFPGKKIWDNEKKNMVRKYLVKIINQNEQTE